MLYLERKPAPPLNGLVRSLWYARAPHVAHRRERVLPTGRVQVILNLQSDWLHECAGDRPAVRTAPALVVGARSVYEIIDSRDMADLIGIVFEPGGFAPFAGDAVDRFSNSSWALEDVWGGQAPALRDRLREIDRPDARLDCLERFLAQSFAKRLARPRPSSMTAVQFALQRFERAPAVAAVREVARQTGWSERRFSQMFREEVGFSPKVWCRIRRFQHTVERLHSGADVPWAELALDCGYYDQSHFANEFKAFSGIDATTYTTTRRTPWANHVPVE